MSTDARTGETAPGASQVPGQQQTPEFRGEAQRPLPICHWLGCSGPMGVSPCDPIRAFFEVEGDQTGVLRAARRSIGDLRAAEAKKAAEQAADRSVRHMENA